MRSYYVYIISNSNNKVLYIGVTNDLVRRVYEHRRKMVAGFTKKYNIYKLLYYEETSDVYEAITKEKQLKKWRRAWKENLINNFNPLRKDLWFEVIE